MSDHEQRDAVAAALHSPVQPECYRDDPKDCDSCQERAHAAITALRERDELKEPTNPWQILIAGYIGLNLLFLAQNIAERKFHLAATAATVAASALYTLRIKDLPREMRLRPRILVPALALVALLIALIIWR